MIAVILVVVMALIAIVHGLWGARIWWPIADEAKLVAVSIGAKGAVRMPPALACYAVVAVMVLCMIWVLLLAHWIVFLPDWIVVFGGVVMGSLFIVRGIAAYTGAFARITPQPEFRWMDTRVYGPLCLGIGIAVLSLT